MSSASARLAPDAAIVLGIASTAMPFARTPEAEAEHWLRILRLHGEAGVALQALGVGEQRLQAPAKGPGSERTATNGAGDRDPVVEVADRALSIAEQRGAMGVATTDLLLAVMSVYGADFDRVLAAYGADRDELTERLSVQLSSE